MIEETIKTLAASLSELAEAIRYFTDSANAAEGFEKRTVSASSTDPVKKPEKEPEKEPAAEEKPKRRRGRSAKTETPAKEPAKEAPAVTLDDVRTAISSLPAKTAVGILHRFGVTKLSDLPEGQYEQVIEDVAEAKKG